MQGCFFICAPGDRTSAEQAATREGARARIPSVTKVRVLRQNLDSVSWNLDSNS